MASKQTIADAFAERLLNAEDKKAATRSILRRMNKLKYKKNHAPISKAGKKKIVELIRAKVSERPEPVRADGTLYATALTYLFRQVNAAEE